MGASTQSATKRRKLPTTPPSQAVVEGQPSAAQTVFIFDEMQRAP